MSHGVAVDVISAAVGPQVGAAHARCGDTDNRIGGLFQNRVGALFNADISGGVHYDSTHVAVVLRCDRDVPQGLKHKIALMADVEEEGVVSCPDSPSIYDIPEVLYKEHLDTFVIRKLGL